MRTVTGTVLRAVPRLGREWSAVEHAVSLPLLDLGPADPATGAWWRISAAVRAEQERPGWPGGPCPDLCLVAVAPSDVDALGRWARHLGRARLTGAGSRLPARAVVEAARLHGVLDLEHGRDAELLHLLAGVRTAAPDVRAAHRRVAARVTRMWTAGAV